MEFIECNIGRWSTSSLTFNGLFPSCTAKSFQTNLHCQAVFKQIGLQGSYRHPYMFEINRSTQRIKIFISFTHRSCTYFVGAIVNSRVSWQGDTIDEIDKIFVKTL